MQTKERIILINGGINLLKKACNASYPTVKRALAWENDTIKQREIRQKAVELNLIKETYQLKE